MITIQLNIRHLCLWLGVSLLFAPSAFASWEIALAAERTTQSQVTQQKANVQPRTTTKKSATKKRITKKAAKQKASAKKTTKANAELLSKLELQRQDFLTAEKLIQANQFDEFQQLVPSLRTYPLYPYLLYAAIKQRIDTLPYADVDRFFAQYADLPLVKSLRYRWLLALAKQERWQDYLVYYQLSKSSKLQCHFLQAQLEDGDKEEALEQIQDMWLVGYSQPKECDDAFDYWFSTGGPNHAQIRERLQMALQNKQHGLAKYLASLTTAQDRQYVKLWRRVAHQPQLVKQVGLFNKSNPMVGDMLVNGVQRLARRDGMQAFQAWRILKYHYPFNREQRQQIIRTIGMSLAIQGHPDGLLWLVKVDKDYVDANVEEWRVRSAITHSRWQQAFYWVAQLPLDKQKKSIWQYWKAKSLLGMQQKIKANKIFQQLSKGNDYYAYLASQQLGRKFTLKTDNFKDKDNFQKNFAQLAGIQRAKELFTLKRYRAARREWQAIVSELPEQQRWAAADLAYQWGWYERAIFSLFKAYDIDDLEIEFPIVHKKLVVKKAKRLKLNPAWVYAMMRQESAFMLDAHSHAGAMGLMQLMPPTARTVSRKHKIPLKSRYELLKPAKNITLGTRYLRDMLDQFDGDLIYATAAYNAGPARITRWLEKSQNLPADVWIDTLPWYETRKYIKNIIVFAKIYGQHLGIDVDISSTFNNKK